MGFNLFKQDCIRLIFLTGSKLTDNTGILEDTYEDGRRLVSFYNMADVKAKQTALQALIKEWITLVEK